MQKHNITPRFMPRLWASVWNMCPLASYDGETQQWTVTWGGWKTAAFRGEILTASGIDKLEERTGRPNRGLEKVKVDGSKKLSQIEQQKAPNIIEKKGRSNKCGNMHDCKSPKGKKALKRAFIKTNTTVVIYILHGFLQPRLDLLSFELMTCNERTAGKVSSEPPRSNLSSQKDGVEKPIFSAFENLNSVSTTPTAGIPHQGRIVSQQRPF